MSEASKVQASRYEQLGESLLGSVLFEVLGSTKVYEEHR
jgi:hypothetical protein